jgi:hypothetical protein
MHEEIDVYLNVRAKEGRLYSDEVVKRLPGRSGGSSSKVRMGRQSGFQRETCRISAPVQETG